MCVVRGETELGGITEERQASFHHFVRFFQFFDFYFVGFSSIQTHVSSLSLFCRQIKIISFLVSLNRRGKKHNREEGEKEEDKEEDKEEEEER